MNRILTLLLTVLLALAGLSGCKTPIVDTRLSEALDTTLPDTLDASAPTPDLNRTPDLQLQDLQADLVLDLQSPEDLAAEDLSDVLPSPDATEDAEDSGWQPDTNPVQSGTTLQPFVVQSFPFVHHFDTTKGQSSQFDRYSCSPTTGETGPEVVYRVTLKLAGRLTIQVLDPTGVDVDIHLLSTLEVDNGTATGCLRRNDATIVEQNVAPGTYYVVADSFSKDGSSFPGSYTLAIEHDRFDVWQTVSLRPGLIWKKKNYTDLAGGTQTVNLLEIDLSVPGVTVKPGAHDGCKRGSETGPPVGAIAGINGGFFDTSNCNPLDLIKIDGNLISMNHLNGAPQPTLGIDSNNTPSIAMIAANTDWPEVSQALGGYPNLVTNGAIDIVPNSTSSFFTSRHPRTAACITTGGKLLLLTVDGRTAAGKGMTIAALAQYMLDLGCDDAMNLDGGGSTSMWVRDGSVNNVVNYPSDNLKSDHFGERGVSDVLRVFVSP